MAGSTDLLLVLINSDLHFSEVQIKVITKVGMFK